MLYRNLLILLHVLQLFSLSFFSFPLSLCLLTFVITVRCLQLVYVTDCHFLFCEAFLQFPSTWAPCWAAEEITIQLLNAKEQGMSQTIGNFIEVVTQNLMQGINAKSKYLVWQQNYLVKLPSFFFLFFFSDSLHGKNNFYYSPAEKFPSLSI